MLRPRPAVVLLVLNFVILFFYGCQQARVNSLDPAGVSFQMPALTMLTAPQANGTIPTGSVTFTWSGNSDQNQYNFTLTNLSTGGIYGESGSWTNDTSFSRTDLDDSPYLFAIAVRYPGLDTSAEYDYYFTIRTETAPALAFMKHYNAVSQGSQLEVDLWGENLTGLFAGDISVKFDPSKLSFVNFAPGDLHDSSDIDQYALLDYALPDPLSKANQAGLIKMSTIFLAKSNQGNVSVSGTGSILKLYFIPKATGQTQLTFQNVDLRDVNGDSMNVQSAEAATVSIK